MRSLTLPTLRISKMFKSSTELAERGLHDCDRPSKINYYSGLLVLWLSGKPNFWVRASIITEVIVTPVLLASTAQ